MKYVICLNHDLRRYDWHQVTDAVVSTTVLRPCQFLSNLFCSKRQIHHIYKLLRVSHFPYLLIMALLEKTF